MIKKAKRRLRGLLPDNAFARGVSVLVGGTATAQLLTILVAPFLTRLYSPEDFGLLAVYASLLALLGVVASLRYELAIPLPENDSDAANVAVLSLLLLGMSTIGTTALVIPTRTGIAHALGIPALANYLWLLPVGVLLGGIYNVFQYWQLRKKRFTTISGTKLRQAFAAIAIQLAAYKLGGVALLYAHVAGQSAGAISMSRPALAGHSFRNVTIRGVADAAKRYHRFPVFTTWAGLLNAGGLHFNLLLLNMFFGPVAAGTYTLAHRVLNTPMSVLGDAIRSVFFANAARAYRDATLARQVENLVARLTQLIAPILLIIAFAGDHIFSRVFGGEWADAGQLARYMTPWLLLQFSVGPLATTFAAIEKQHIGLMLQAQMFLARIAAIFLGALFGNIDLAIILFSLASFLSYAVFLAFIARYTGARLAVLIAADRKSVV